MCNLSCTPLLLLEKDNSKNNPVLLCMILKFECFTVSKGKRNGNMCDLPFRTTWTRTVFSVARWSTEKFHAAREKHTKQLHKIVTRNYQTHTGETHQWLHWVWENTAVSVTRDNGSVRKYETTILSSPHLWQNHDNDITLNEASTDQCTTIKTQNLDCSGHHYEL